RLRPLADMLNGAAQRRDEPAREDLPEDVAARFDANERDWLGRHVRAAWDYIEQEGGGTELVVLNPTWIAGPTLTSDARSSLQAFSAMLGGQMPLAPRQRFGIADVRDVASAHLAAMSTPDAAGKRYLLLADGPTTSWLGVANVLHEHFGTLAAKAPTEEAPGDDLPPLLIHNERAKAELGFSPRPAETTIVDTVENMLEQGMLG
ncbi:MAG: hypothetical protein V4479_00585, partial [Actinomycetota bacterium]